MIAAVAICIVEVIRLVLDPDPVRRERGADEATDVLGGVGAFGRHAFAMAICAALALDGPSATVEAQLNALAEIATYGELPDDARDLLRAIDRSTLDDLAKSQLDELLSDR
jgi:hypothetical protein